MSDRQTLPTFRVACLYPSGSMNVHVDGPNGRSAEELAKEEAQWFNDNLCRQHRRAKVVRLTIAEITILDASK